MAFKEPAQNMSKIARLLAWAFRSWKETLRGLRLSQYYPYVNIMHVSHGRSRTDMSETSGRCNECNMAGQTIILHVPSLQLTHHTFTELSNVIGPFLFIFCTRSFSSSSPSSGVSPMSASRKCLEPDVESNTGK